MPAIRPPARVLVTGANGYIASWIVLTLLQRGYTVRGTVRTTEKGECLKQSMVKRAPIEASKFEYVVVSDICEASMIMISLGLMGSNVDRYLFSQAHSTMQ